MASKKQLFAAVVGLLFAAIPSAALAEETYRLMHALGNDERVIARDLSKSDCEARKKEYQTVATQMGTYNEATGKGSITCLPESMF